MASNKPPLMTCILVLAAIGLVMLSAFTTAAPSGVTIIPLKNETATPSAASFINTSGGSITTINLNGTTQNLRWKAFVGNVSGSLTLDDASNNTVYSWNLVTVSGEVYATRASRLINWTGINCSNLTHLEGENFALNHTNPDDNISATFSVKDHSRFYIGTSEITDDSCFSVHTYVNGTAQQTPSNFEETVLYDGTNLTDGTIVYSSLLEQDAYGYNNQTYDFQMILPERGLATWKSSTAYYFYIELS